MSAHAAAHAAPVGGRLWTRPFRVLVAIALVGAAVALVRFARGIGAVANVNDGYPWGVWIGIDVVVGTALGCGGYAVAILAYVLNKGRYHPVVRPAVLTGLLGYGFAALGVIVDLGRFWELWKVPVFFWRWSESPQLEVALCVMTYVAVLAVEASPAVLERLAEAPRWRDVARGALRLLDRLLPFILAAGLLLPTMHQSSLGTMMLLPGPRVHPLWFTRILPLLFLVNCVGIGYAVVILEASFSARAFARPRHGALLTALSRVAGGVALCWAAMRVAEVAWAGELPLVRGGIGLAFVAEVALPVAGAAMLLAPRLGAREVGQVRAAILLLLGGVLFRVDTYLVAFQPGPQWSYFPSVPELLITFGMIAAEVALYVAAVKTFPILSAPAAPARSPR
jgi:Ni/Fe-hydrogenase subunit HybB-like protein